MRLYLLPLILIVLCSLATVGYAGMITELPTNEAHYSGNYLYNDNIKIQLNFDKNGIDNDTDLCEDLDCSIQAYDYVIDKSTNEVVAKWSMFRLQRSNGKQWRTIKTISNDYQDCSGEDYACVKRVMKLTQNTDMNITYLLKDGENKVKFTIDIIGGNEKKEYRLKYRINSDEQILDMNSNAIQFSKFFYDWNDIQNYPTNREILNNGYTFQQMTNIGNLDSGVQVQIDPLITTDTTTVNPSHTNLLKDSNGDYWFVAKNTTHRLIYKSDDNGGTWSLNSTNSNNFANVQGWASVIDSNDVIHIADSLGATVKGVYANFSTTSGTWNTDISITKMWEGEYIAMDIDESNNIIITGADYSDDDSWWFMRYANGTWASNLFIAQNSNYRNRGASISKDVFGGLYTRSDISDHSYFDIKNKTTGSSIASDYILFATTFNNGDAITVDYDNNYMLGCSYDLTASLYFDVGCLVFNGTGFGSGETDWLVTNGVLNTTDYIYLAKTDTDVYLIAVNDNDKPYAVRFNQTDWLNNNIDLDVDHPIQIDVEQNVDITSDDIQIMKVNDSTIKFAYKSQTGADWYFDEFPKGLTVFAYDEETESLLTSWNIYVNNGTATDTKTGISYYADYWSGSSIQVRGSKTGYGTRSYYISIPAYGDYYPLNIYLLNSSNGNYVRFHVYDSFSNPQPLTSVIAKRLMGSNWTQVEGGLTDSSGTATMFLDPSVTYLIGFNNTNCTYKQDYITPTAEDYAIPLSCAITGNFTNYTSRSEGLTYSIYPSSGGLCNQSQPFYFYLNDTEDRLLDYGINLTYNGSVIWSDSGSTSGGENMTTTEDLSASLGALTMMYYYTRVPYNETMYFTKNYFVWNYNCNQTNLTKTSIQSVIDGINTGVYEIPDMFLLIVALFMSIVGAGVSAYLGTGFGGTAIIFLSIMMFFVWAFGILSWGLVGILVLSMAVVLLIKLVM